MSLACQPLRTPRPSTPDCHQAASIAYHGLWFRTSTMRRVLWAGIGAATLAMTAGVAPAYSQDEKKPVRIEDAVGVDRAGQTPASAVHQVQSLKTKARGGRPRSVCRSVESGLLPSIGGVSVARGPHKSVSTPCGERTCVPGVRRFRAISVGQAPRRRRLRGRVPRSGSS